MKSELLANTVAFISCRNRLKSRAPANLKEKDLKIVEGKGNLKEKEKRERKGSMGSIIESIDKSQETKYREQKWKNKRGCKHRKILIQKSMFTADESHSVG